MPELPEVETLRLALEPALRHRSILRVDVLARTSVAMPDDPPAGILRARSAAYPAPLNHSLLLAGCTIDRIERRGKQLAIISAQGPAIMLHLGMSGRCTFDPTPTPHDRVLWHTDSGSTLRFIDPRRFGLVAAHPTFEDLKSIRWTALGPDALSLTTTQLRAACKAAQRPIKSVLLDQHRIAGIGNIYADEALFAARLHPLQPASTLDSADHSRLARCVRTILQRAITAGGSTIRDHKTLVGAPGSYQAQHLVYGRADQPCTRCSTPLQGLRLSGRSTVFCPACQSPSA